jgi:hypothetical protein
VSVKLYRVWEIGESRASQIVEVADAESYAHAAEQYALDRIGMPTLELVVQLVDQEGHTSTHQMTADYGGTVIDVYDNGPCRGEELPTALDPPAPEVWRVVRRSNFDHEDERGNEHFVCESSSMGNAELVCCALNFTTPRRADNFYIVVGADYQLRPDWTP